MPCALLSQLHAAVRGMPLASTSVTGSREHGMDMAVNCMIISDHAFQVTKLAPSKLYYPRNKPNLIEFSVPGSY
jgi:hypothetical protein